MGMRTQLVLFSAALAFAGCKKKDTGPTGTVVAAAVTVGSDRLMQNVTPDGTAGHGYNLEQVADSAASRAASSVTWVVGDAATPSTPTTPA